MTLLVHVRPSEHGRSLRVELEKLVVEVARVLRRLRLELLPGFSNELLAFRSDGRLGSGFLGSVAQLRVRQDAGIIGWPITMESPSASQ